jgi:hypothetical protein
MSPSSFRMEGRKTCRTHTTLRNGSTPLQSQHLRQPLRRHNNRPTRLKPAKASFPRTFSGPSIRERLLYNETGSYVRYSGYDFLNPVPTELFNDAEYTPKLAAVSVTLSGEEILKNAGKAQLLDVMDEHISAAERELVDRFVEDLHSAGSPPTRSAACRRRCPRP